MEAASNFLELSALLTGLYPIANDEEQRSLNLPIAAEYQRRLTAVFPEKLLELVNAYATLSSTSPKPKLDDVLLGKLRALPAFDSFVALQVVNIWYFSQFKTKKDDAHHLDGGFYERGAVWPLIKAHPPGFSSKPHGYWSEKP